MVERERGWVKTELSVRAGGNIRVTCDWWAQHPYALEVEYPSPVSGVKGVMIRLTRDELKALRTAIDGLFSTVQELV